MSSALPFLFKKCVYKSELYIDGGFVNNFPLDLAVEDGREDILALRIKEEKPRSVNDNLLTLVNNLFFVPMVAREEEVAAKYGDKCLLIPLVSNLSVYALKIENSQALMLLVEGFCAAIEHVRSHR